MIEQNERDYMQQESTLDLPIVERLEQIKMFISQVKLLYQMGFPEPETELYDSIIDTLSEAADRLKDQEPRVLTLKELEDWDGAVFFEAIETDMYYVLIETVEPSAGMKGAYVFINVGHGEHYRRVWDGEHYGSIWRCWTSRPTVDQRKAVKWCETVQENG